MEKLKIVKKKPYRQTKNVDNKPFKLTEKQTRKISNKWVKKDRLLDNPLIIDDNKNIYINNNKWKVLR